MQIKILYIKYKIKQALLTSLSIGIITTILLVINPSIFMNIIYSTDIGSNYIRIMAPFFLLLYIQTPLVTVLQAIDKSKAAMMNTLIGSIIKVILLIILSNLKIGLYSLIIATIFNIIFVTINDIKKIKRYLISSK